MFQPSYVEQPSSGKKIHGFPSFTFFIQPVESQVSLWAGINLTNWTHTKLEKDVIAKLLERSLPMYLNQYNLANSKINITIKHSNARNWDRCVINPITLDERLSY